ncbi:hypothetical protein [Stenotrophomonas maltophilia]|uniref:hypothetical protein n=1 Tax=Stenotrophomonas maltophilia TaxID=40324 RepID=UPI0012DB26A4|nr:hypothetical protein [Stenotrophomonas maltophilia]
MICLHFICVARIQQRVDDLLWQAFLDFHLDYRQRIVRPCQNQWTGRDGMVLWVIRHQDRLRHEVAAILAAREAGKIKDIRPDSG